MMNRKVKKKKKEKERKERKREKEVQKQDEQQGHCEGKVIRDPSVRLVSTAALLQQWTYHEMSPKCCLESVRLGLRM